MCRYLGDCVLVGCLFGFECGRRFGVVVVGGAEEDRHGMRHRLCGDLAVTMVDHGALNE